MKKIVLFALGLVVCATTHAQEKDFEATIASDVVSRYIWRGQDLGHVSFQPTLGVSYRGLSLEAWGSVGLTDSSDTKEFDLTLSYSAGGFNIGITDYWTDAGLDPRNRYFKYDAHGTNHVFEATIGYDFGVASVEWSTNFAGNDGVNKDGESAYSSYLEASVPFRVAGLEWTGIVGAVPFATDYYETDGFAVTNLSLQATKDIKVTDTFSIPIFAQVDRKSTRLNSSHT